MNIDVPELPRLQDGFEYKQAVEMLVVTLPPGCSATWFHSPPSNAKEDPAGRLSVYWLADTNEVEVGWSLKPSGANLERLAAGIRNAVRAGLKRFSVDEFEYYDFALSYASEDL